MIGGFVGVWGRCAHISVLVMTPEVMRLVVVTYVHRYANVYDDVLGTTVVHLLASTHTLLT